MRREGKRGREGERTIFPEPTGLEPVLTYLFIGNCETYLLHDYASPTLLNGI